jgi:hypothetical protein
MNNLLSSCMIRLPEMSGQHIANKNIYQAAGLSATLSNQLSARLQAWCICALQGKRWRNHRAALAAGEHKRQG